jgi:hypothetical protein
MKTKPTAKSKKPKVQDMKPKKNANGGDGTVSKATPTLILAPAKGVPFK